VLGHCYTVPSVICCAIQATSISDRLRAGTEDLAHHTKFLRSYPSGRIGTSNYIDTSWYIQTPVETEPQHGLSGGGRRIFASNFHVSSFRSLSKYCKYSSQAEWIIGTQWIRKRKNRLATSARTALLAALEKTTLTSLLQPAEATVQWNPSSGWNFRWNHLQSAIHDLIHLTGPAATGSGSDCALATWGTQLLLLTGHSDFTN